MTFNDSHAAITEAAKDFSAALELLTQGSRDLVNEVDRTTQSGRDLIEAFSGAPVPTDLDARFREALEEANRNVAKVHARIQEAYKL